jgi:hypothetical protein
MLLLLLLLLSSRLLLSHVSLNLQKWCEVAL